MTGRYDICAECGQHANEHGAIPHRFVKPAAVAFTTCFGCGCTVSQGSACKCFVPAAAAVEPAKCGYCNDTRVLTGRDAYGAHDDRPCTFCASPAVDTTAETVERMKHRLMVNVCAIDPAKSDALCQEAREMLRALLADRDRLAKELDAARVNERRLQDALDLLLDASGNCGESGYGGPEPTPWDVARAALAAQEGK